jgi:hypothetical protein
MKKKLEELAEQHTIVMCCECKGIKYDKHSWIYESEAHDLGLHHHYKQLVITKMEQMNVSHGYCPPCFKIALKEQNDYSNKVIKGKQ